MKVMINGLVVELDRYVNIDLKPDITENNADDLTEYLKDPANKEQWYNDH